MKKRRKKKVPVLSKEQLRQLLIEGSKVAAELDNKMKPLFRIGAKERMF